MSVEYPVERIFIDFRPDSLDYIDVRITVSDTASPAFRSSLTYNREISRSNAKSSQLLEEIANATLPLISLDK